MSGVLTISIELELGWGVHDVEDSRHLSADGSTEREYLSKLVEKTEDCNVPISFDIVGHLLLDECDGTHEGPYDAEWFEADPGTDASTNPLYYAPDMAEQIVTADVDHELCTHTFSHTLCNAVSEDVIAMELQHVRNHHEQFGEQVTSLVPPRHCRAPNEVLRQNRIRTVRYGCETNPRTPLHRFKELTIGPHPQWEPRVQDGVLETYCTKYPSLTASSLPAGQRDPPAVFRPLPVAVRKRIHEYYLKRAVHRAIASGTPLHLWCHLFDLSNEHQWAVLSNYFEYLATIPEDQLKIQTMNQLATEYRDSRAEKS